MMKDRIPFKGVEENKAIRAILEGTSTHIGEKFFVSLVENLSKVLNTYGSWVTEYIEEERRLRALAFLLGDQWIKHFEYAITGTPCEIVVREHRLVHVRDKLFELYKGNPDLGDFGKSGAISYLGVPLVDINGRILGHLSVVDKAPIPKKQQVINIFRIFANRASAEMQRLRAEKETLEREEKLRRLFHSAMDAIIELDKNLKITRVNAAATKVFGFTGEEVLGRRFNEFLTKASSEKLVYLSQSLDEQTEGQNYTWIPGGLKGINEEGKQFPAEATLSRFEMDNENFYTIILRNVNERILAEQKIKSLTLESEYLKEELTSLTNFDEIIGDSEAIRNVLRDVKQVATTDSTVLILGETGTGKELIARSIHSSSKRAHKQFVKVNCAAIPSNLIESEFFGHEQGAFTGATKKREGRFSIANGGTIFLDEIGELPIDLQAKLLRVLQEGEFEPVGSSRTVKVDARVITATNRDISKAVKEGSFREDLYYRLNVFPIVLPPLRERSDDIEKLARAFIEKFSKRNGITLEPLSEEHFLCLKSYNWPGNIRELQNVIERAVITSTNGRLNLDRALPDLGNGLSYEASSRLVENDNKILSDKELKAIERKNILYALEKTNWRISGKSGAAALLCIPTSTLNSKIKAFGIKRNPKY
jgi:PAS domain S-box-containing protein